MDLKENIHQYIIAHTTHEDILLAELSRETHLKVMYPRMLSGHFQGKLLEMISRMVAPSYILEIGTYTGYSAICLAKGLKNPGKLMTIEVNPELTNLSAQYFEKAGFLNQIEQITGDAKKVIPQLEEDFDLVFIDAAKEDYPDYYRLVFDKVRQGGYILADNALWDNKVIENDNPDKETGGIMAFNNLVMEDVRVENILLPVRDGLMLIRKKYYHEIS